MSGAFLRRVQTSVAAIVVMSGVWSGVWSDPASGQTSSCAGNCMVSDGPADNPNFHACIRRLCHADHVQPSRHIPVWKGGGIKDGKILWAGVDSQDGQQGFYYFCQSGGISELVIPGIPGNVQELALTVDGKTHQRRFQKQGNQVTAPVVPNDPLMRDLRGGKGVVIESLTGGNKLLLAFHLINAEEALEGAMVGCGFMQEDARPLGAAPLSD